MIPGRRPPRKPFRAGQAERQGDYHGQKAEVDGKGDPELRAGALQGRIWDRQPDACAPDGESEAVKLAFRGMWVARDAKAMVHGRRDGAARALHAVRAAIDATHAGLEAKKLNILSRPSQLRSAGDMLDVLDSAMAMHHEEKTALGRLHGMEQELQDELAAADVAAGLAETQHDSAMRLVYEAFKDSRRAT